MPLGKVQPRVSEIEALVAQTPAHPVQLRSHCIQTLSSKGRPTRNRNRQRTPTRGAMARTQVRHRTTIEIRARPCAERLPPQYCTKLACLRQGVAQDTHAGRHLRTST